MPRRRQFLKERRTKQGNRCEHNSFLLMMTATETGCYARCLGCSAAGPERTSPTAARKALLVLGMKGGGYGEAGGA